MPEFFRILKLICECHDIIVVTQVRAFVDNGFIEIGEELKPYAYESYGCYVNFVNKQDPKTVKSCYICLTSKLSKSPGPRFFVSDISLIAGADLDLDPIDQEKKRSVISVSGKYEGSEEIIPWEWRRPLFIDAALQITEKLLAL